MSSLRDEFAAMRPAALALPPEIDAPTRKQREVKRRRAKKRQSIAILDMETDPFNNETQENVFPFLAVLYSDDFETVVIWDEDHETFVSRLFDAIHALPGKYTIFAHNGGKFDFMFLVNRLRGAVSFKGRGIMRATIGDHELRDSYHIIPEKLASMMKEDFDYTKLYKKDRDKHRQSIIDYCISDCANLLYFVKRFIDKYGFKISVGVAAIAKLGESYRVEKVTQFQDAQLRKFFFGGRVECIAGAGYFAGAYKLYDVNSMYPFVMSSFRHPIGSEYVSRSGNPSVNTVFLRLQCQNNGALLARNDDGDLVATIREGEFCTTIWEYQAALDLGLIADVKILECIDNFNRTNFEKFVTPLYSRRAEEKARLDTLVAGTHEYEECKAEVLFLKLIMNNAYGKFAQNPRRYKEHFISDPGLPSPVDDFGSYGDMPEYLGADYWIWSRPAPELRFNNVGTAASITGGARSILMRAIAAAKNPIYCDTDSLICEELSGHDLHHTRLGAWDLEKDISELIVCGKKLYAYKSPGGQKTIIKSKGTAGLAWDDMLALLHGETRVVTNRGPTLTRTGRQHYIRREIRATAKLPNERKAIA
jgi:hypothetical protein